MLARQHTSDARHVHHEFRMRQTLASRMPFHGHLHYIWVSGTDPWGAGMWWSRVSHRPTASQVGAIRVLTILVCLTTSLLAATLQDPPQLVSRNGVLNLRIHPGD